MIKYITDKDFQRKYGSQKACLTALLNYRISEDGLCFNGCKAPISNYKYLSETKRKALLCPRCLHHTYPMVDSIFNHSHVAIEDWFQIIYEMLRSRNGISANEICNRYGYSYKTAFNIIHAIRDQMSKCVNFRFVNEAVEIDESFLRSGNKGMKKNTSLGVGRGNRKHTGILCIVARGGAAKLLVIPNAEGDTLLSYIQEFVDTSCRIYTDEWKGYSGLERAGYSHKTVNHSKEFTDGPASTNNCENIFSNLKRIIFSTHRSVNHRKIQSYLDEYSFRYSYRNHEDYGFEVFMQSFSSLSEHYVLRNAA